VWTAHPELDNTQLFDVMRMSAHDIDTPGYDAATGFGLLNIPAALAFAAPARDPLEPNDNIDQVSPHGLFTGGQPAIVTASRPAETVSARVDRHEDPRDVYRVFVPAHGSATARTSDGAVDMRIFGSAARSIVDSPVAKSTRSGTQPEIATVRNKTARGVYVYVEVHPDPSIVRTSYTLRVTASARR
jgi:hypothetical protein